RITNVGRAYLLKSCAEPEKWLSQDQFYPPAVAGCRYLHLFAKLDPSWVEALPTHVWGNWAAILLDFHEERDESLRRKLVATAYRAAPDTVLEALRVILLKESQRSDDPSVLGRMEDCWDDRFGRFVLDFVRSVDLRPPFWGALLVALLDHAVAG